MTKPSVPLTSLAFGPDGKTAMSGRRATRILDGIPDSALAGAGAFLAGCARMFAGALDGTVVTAHVPVAPWGAADGTPTEQLGRFMQDARAAGWHCTNAALEHGSGWVTFTRGGSPTVHLGVSAAMADDPPLFNRRWRAEEIARQLAAFADGMGVPYRTTPGITGCEVIRRYHETKLPGRGGFRAVPTWVWRDGAIMRDITTPGEIHWERKLTTAERAMRYVHVFDVTKQYLAAMAAAEVSWPAPEHTGAELFDPSRGGIWQLRLAAADRRPGAKGKTLPPVINVAKVSPAGLVWVTTPIAALLQRMGVPFEALDSWTAPRVRHTNAAGKELPGTGRWLREPAERMRDAVVMHGRPLGHAAGFCDCARCRLAATFKATANGAVGMLAAPHSAMRRPDVAATIRDLARVLLLMKLQRAHHEHRIAPVRVVHDAVFYVSDDPSPDDIGTKIGATRNGQIGRLRHDRTLSMADYVTEATTRGKARTRTRRPAEANA